MPHAVDILRSRTRSPLALLLALLLAGCGTEPAGGAAAPAHGGGTSTAFSEAQAMVAAKRAEILPDEAERRWEEIAFLPSYTVGLQEASIRKKPLMLWVMNGHPLGCT